MDRKLGGLIAAAAMLCGHLAMAQESNSRWELVTTGPDLTVSFDRSTLLHQDEGLVTVWVKYDHTGKYGKYVSGQSVVKSMQREQYICKLMRSAVLSSVSFNAAGDGVVHTETPNAVATPVIPDTVTESVWRRVCQ